MIFRIHNKFNNLKRFADGICFAPKGVRELQYQGETMKLRFNIFLNTALIGLIAFGLSNCGSGTTNSISMSVNGQQHQVALKNPICQAGQATGAGLYNLPIVCSAGFSNTNGIADAFVVTITDARTVQDSLGVFIPISPALLIFNMTLDGTQYAVTQGGAVFSEVSNLLGGKNCFQFQVDSAQIHMEGNFCGTNTSGF